MRLCGALICPVGTSGQVLNKGVGAFRGSSTKQGAYPKVVGKQGANQEISGSRVKVGGEEGRLYTTLAREDGRYCA